MSLKLVTPASLTFVKHCVFSRRIFVENFKQMEISQEKKEKILRNAEILQWKTLLLIEACDGWLTAEEGNRNMEKRFMENRKNKIKN